MAERYYFPFGEKLKKIEQKDKSPKKVFVLGVYASAVHARWSDKDGKQKVPALAVASEPEIFWTGDNAQDIIKAIEIPDQLGRLSVPTNKKLNGPSGRALNNLFLLPLGLDRSQTWLCDMLPFSRVNKNQRQAIDKHYTKEIINEFNLAPANIPDFNKAELNSQARREEILDELEISKAEIMVLLGDLPIYWFLRFHNKKYLKLSEFGETGDTYGRLHEFKINDKFYNVIPLCHPRQADALGTSITKWKNLHDRWINSFKLRLF